MTVSASEISVGDFLPQLDRKMRAQQIVSAAAASRDWMPIHHDHRFATEKSGLRDIILNAPSQAGWISRYITDWTGPEGRVKSLEFRMKDSICPGDAMTVTGEVTEIQDATQCGCWVTVNVRLMVEDQLKTDAVVKVAIPGSNGVSPWRCATESWMSAG
jgi:acyl dehydratase